MARRDGPHARRPTSAPPPGKADRARRQLGLFRVILVVVSTIIMALIIYTLTLDKTHDIAMLKLMGARHRVIAGLILQQALLLGALGYGIAMTSANGFSLCFRGEL